MAYGKYSQFGVQNQGPSSRLKPVTKSWGIVVLGELGRHLHHWGVGSFSGTTRRARRKYFPLPQGAAFRTQVVPIFVHKNGPQKWGKNALRAIDKIVASTRETGSKVAPKIGQNGSKICPPKVAPSRHRCQPHCAPQTTCCSCTDRPAGEHALITVGKDSLFRGSRRTLYCDSPEVGDGCGAGFWGPEWCPPIEQIFSSALRMLGVSRGKQSLGLLQQQHQERPPTPARIWRRRAESNPERCLSLCPPWP